MDLDALLRLLQSPEFTISAAAGLAGILFGWIAGRSGARGGTQRIVAKAPTEIEMEMRDFRRTIQILQSENGNLSTFLMTMPDLARELNSDRERRSIPEILIAFIESLFKAEQIHIFLARDETQELRLVDGRGIPPDIARDAITPGVGRVGWVAKHQVTMDDGDFRTKSATVRGLMENAPDPRIRSELCAPMVDPANRTLGVISLGGLLKRPKNEKNMLKMVADFGSIAIQNRRLLAQVKDYANRDGLTGLTNKRFFAEQAAVALHQAEKMHTPLSVFIFDIDHFKTYNDTNGHLAGDECLRITGRLLRENTRDRDLAARWGGEEFALLLPGSDKATAMAVAEKIRRRIESEPYPEQSSQPNGCLTISGGVATYPEDAQSMNDLMRCADEALYKGKKEGRNRVNAYRSTYLTGEQAGGGGGMDGTPDGMGS